MRVGLATAAVLAVVIVISAFLLVRGYNQNLPPSASSSITQAGQNWPIYEPIKITFNKPMNKASVEENLKITPPGERARIPLSWDHNTLIVGASSSESALFIPDTNYTVVVLAGARDSYGQALADSLSITFRTSSITEAAHTPTPVPSRTSVATATTGQKQQSANVPSPESNAPSTPSTTEQSTATSSGPVVIATTTKTPTPPSASPQPSATPAPNDNAVNTATPTPTAQPTQNAATPAGTPTGTPSTAGTPVATATATATPTPSDQTPGATPVASATADTGTPSSDVVPVTGAFGSVYWANSDVQKKLGNAQAPEAHMSAAELGFQHGTMYERFDTGEIYALYADNQWSPYTDTWTAAEGEGGGPAPQDKLYVPKGSFGKVWNSDPDLQQNIGYAVNSDVPHVMGGVVQQFAHGIMLYSDQGFVYVVYDDGSWAPYPDTSGHGDLITPTPTASETPIATPADATTPEATEPVTPAPSTP